jgi:hypothetical protein
MVARINAQLEAESTARGNVEEAGLTGGERGAGVLVVGARGGVLEADAARGEVDEEAIAHVDAVDTGRGVNEDACTQRVEIEGVDAVESTDIGVSRSEVEGRGEPDRVDEAKGVPHPGQGGGRQRHESLHARGSSRC